MIELAFRDKDHFEQFQLTNKQTEMADIITYGTDQLCEVYVVKHRYIQKTGIVLAWELE